MVALSDAQKKANEKYLKNNYKQVKLSMPKAEAEAEALEEYCTSKKIYKGWIYSSSYKGKNGKRTIIKTLFSWFKKGT